MRIGLLEEGGQQIPQALLVEIRRGVQKRAPGPVVGVQYLLQQEALHGLPQQPGQRRDEHRGVQELPAVLGQGGALRPDPEAADRLVVRLFGLAAAPTSVVVMNASGSPAAAELVAERLLPAGFRLVVSSDAEAFPTTAIVASTHGDRATAEQVRELLGVGEVVVSRVPSGLGEVTVMIGEDLGNG